MGQLKQYISSSWTSLARGGGSGGSGTSFDTNAHIRLNANQAVTTGAPRKVLFDTVVFDGNSEWVAASNYWQSKATGYYHVVFSAAPLNTYTNYFRCSLYVDGAAVAVGQNITGITGTTTASVIVIPNLYVAIGSYVEAYVEVNASTSVAANATATWLRITRYK